MQKKIFLVFCLANFIVPVVLSQQDMEQLGIEARFKKNFEILDSIAKGGFVDSTFLASEAIDFMERMTSISGQADGTYFGKLHFTDKDLAKWHNWYELNRRGILDEELTYNFSTGNEISYTVREVSKYDRPILLGFSELERIFKFTQALISEEKYKLTYSDSTGSFSYIFSTSDPRSPQKWVNDTLETTPFVYISRDIFWYDFKQFEVYKFSKNLFAYDGCNNIFWSPGIGIILVINPHWKNFRIYLPEGSIELQKKISLIVMRILIDSEFCYKCGF